MVEFSSLFLFLIEFYATGHATEPNTTVAVVGPTQKGAPAAKINLFFEKSTNLLVSSSSSSSSPKSQETHGFWWFWFCETHPKVGFVVSNIKKRSAAARVTLMNLE